MLLEGHGVTFDECYVWEKTPEPFGQAPEPFGQAPEPFGQAPEPLRRNLNYL